MRTGRLPSAAMEEPLTRAELLAGYERPYARWLPIAWRVNSVPQLAIAAVMVDLAAVAAHAVLVDGAPALLVGLAVLVSVIALVWWVWTTVVAVQVIRRRVGAWRPDASELDRVRRRRAHAGDADAGLVHDEYAVTVTDDGQIVTWRFTPLPADAVAPAGATVLGGVPVHAAEEAGRTPFDATDTGRAAEQLAEAQQAGAEL